jgi:hypothetical protein
MCKPKGLVRPEGLGKMKKFIHLIGSRTRDLPESAPNIWGITVTLKPCLTRACIIAYWVLVRHEEALTYEYFDA